MKLSLSLNGKQYAVDSHPLDVSIPMQFDGPQPNTYGVRRASAKAYETGGFVGDVRRGGSCNFEEYTFVPHCNGTHTECIGHLAQERIAVINELKDALIPATVVTLDPAEGLTCGESYPVAFNPGDQVLTAKTLQNAIAGIPDGFLKALLIRTTPNSADKKSRDYMALAPAFFTLDCMKLIRQLGVKHLLTDLPSVDRLFDEGKLGAHRIFWEVPAGETYVGELHSAATITEMIFVPDEVKDGIYLLNLQVAPFVSDAAPSRPVLFTLIAE